MKGVKRDLYQDITNQVLSLMEQHGTDWVKPWAGSGIPVNAATGAEYRGSNVLQLGLSAAVSGYSTNIWATYKQWQSLGAQVRKGEKSTGGILFKPLVKREVDADGEEHERAIPMIRGFSVFNADQVDGWEPEASESLEGADLVEHAEEFVQSSGADIRHGAGGAFYVPSQDRITMPPPGDFVGSDTSSATEAYYGTLLHELSHWTGHESRLARKLRNRFGSAEYAAEELVAELSSAFLCAHLGISPSPRADHAKYLNSWMRKLREDKRAFTSAASAAQKAADYLRALHESQQQQPVAEAA